MSSYTKPASLTKIEPDDPALTAPEEAVAADPPSVLPILERVEAAERLSERDLAVFPAFGVRREGRPPFVCLCSKAGMCGSPGKHPQTSDGVHAASRNFADLRVEWCDRRANIGIATGPKSDVWVLDVDPRNGGDESLVRLEASHGNLPTTWTVRTGGGGIHYYYKLGAKAVRCSTSKVGPGLDVKADGGYVIAPPSLHRSGKKYEWESGRSPDDIDVAEAPDWLLNLVTGDSSGDDVEKRVGNQRDGDGAPMTQTAAGKAGRPDDDYQDDGVIVEGSRNSEVFSFACGLVREGVPKTELFDEARAFNSSRCVPPLPDAEIQQIVDSAWRYKSGAPTDTDTNDISQSRDPHFLDACTVEALLERDFPDPRWAIEEIIPEGLGVLAGRPKVGKSWLALQASISVASGRCTFGDFNVEPAKALYVGLEDGLRRFKWRTRKHLKFGGVPPSSLFLIEQGQIRTLDGGGLDQIRWFLDKHPEIRLVVIDTLGRFKGGRRTLNNDRYQDDVVVGDKLQRVAHDYGISLLLVHHVRKAEAEDWVDTISGSTGIAGSADYLLVLKRAREGADATLHVTGRDIVEQSFAMDFDPDTCLWKVSGNAAEVAMSRQRAVLVTFLRSQGTPETPTNIAAALGLSVNNVKNLLWKMKEAGQVQSEGGKYFVEKLEASKDDLEVPDEELRRPRRIKK